MRLFPWTRRPVEDRDRISQRRAEEIEQRLARVEAEVRALQASARNRERMPWRAAC